MTDTDDGPAREGSPRVDRSVDVRVAGVAGSVAIPALWLWALRERWGMAAVALLVLGVAGLAGGGLYWLAVERRRAPTGLTGWFAAAGLTATLGAGSAAWFAGEWRGVLTAVGAVAAGTSVGCWLAFLRMAVSGLPRPDDEAGG